MWCGPGFGWLGLDPTNAIPAGDDHIFVARGRDYSDVPPVEGLIVSSGAHALEVEVDVIPGLSVKGPPCRQNRTSSKPTSAPLTP